MPLGVVRLLTFPTCCPVSAELPVIIFVKAPVLGVLFPISVLSMSPLSILTFVNAWELQFNPPVRVVALNSLKTPCPAELIPMLVPSIAPPSIFTVPIFTVPFPEPSILDIVKLPIPSIVEVLLNNTSVSWAVPIETSAVKPSTAVEKIVPCTLKTAKLDL